MRRLSRWLLLAALTAAVLPAQPEGAAPEARREAGQAKEGGESKGHGEHGGLQGWAWVNFLLLAGGLGYLIGKNAGPFFAARSKQIRMDIAEAEEQRQEAEARAAEVDRRLGNLQAEIEALRREAHEEQSAEEQRIAQRTAAEAAKIRQQAEQEIDAAGKAARLELKRYSAELAVTLAEQKVRGRLTAEGQDALVREFASDLKPLEPRAREQASS